MLAKEIDHAHLKRRLQVEKLSSGKRLKNSSDDVGALSSKIKQSGDLKRLQGVRNIIQNAKSYLEARDGAMQTVHSVYDRMSQLATMSMDITKNQADRDNYESEFQSLREEAIQISREKFNGIALFRDKEYTLVNRGTKINWTDSKAEVDALSASDKNNTHYLATITSELEQLEIAFQIGSVGINAWLGANDVVEEGKWTWTEGPDAGTLFWDGDKNGTETDGLFANWGGGEPNDYGSAAPGDENYLQISQGSTPAGSWNDLPDTNTTGSSLQPTGYVRETDQNDLTQLDDEAGGSFTLPNALFQRFILSSMISINTMDDSQKALSSLGAAIEGILDSRTIVGASISRIDKELKGLGDNLIQKEQTLSRIEDVDMARAATQLAKAEIKIQSTASVFAQANELFNKRNYVAELL